VNGSITRKGKTRIDDGERMKDEYDFSKAERGKFYKPNLRLIPPVRLDPTVLEFLATQAEARGTTVNQLVNQLLKKDIEQLKATG
jgi:hypothetical protein